MKNTDLIKQVEKWINDTHPHPKHLVRTGYWVQHLETNASDELIVACITHDIERAFKEGRNPPSREDGSMWEDKEYLLWHGRRSADFVSAWLKDKGVNQEFIQKVWRLVDVHEIGGNDEENLIKDADSISFLEINVPLFISFIPQRYTKEQVRQKVDYMFNRITSKKAKEIAKPFYDQATTKLNQMSVYVLTERQRDVLKQVIDILQRNNIPFQITGGLAAIAYDAQRHLNDIDLDVYKKDIEKLRVLFRKYITEDFHHMHNEHFDIYMMTISIDGVPIDLSQAEEAHFIGKDGVKIRSDSDITKAQVVTFEGLQFPIQNKDELMRYKQILSRDTDLIDIEQII